ncbi:hypothetical protein POTOM_028271 [Populus tomentosa]|uniref:Pentatricopeptide repeat-containing protein n=1 Tax=Populus tomentosa TaxID=118781 RepID=A0A8X8CUT2_POPTO|nr:hypothetical protein POTOM_028271 [Populus tomentosa]
MVNNKFKPNQVTIDVAIRSLCSIGRVDYIVLLVKEFSLKHSKPDIFTYNFLVKSLCKSRILNSVYSFIDEMKNIFNIKHDTIIKGYYMLSKGIEAVRIYKQMKEEGVLPDLVMYNTLNFGLSKCVRVSEAKKFLKIMVELGRFADVVTYTSLMNGMCREEDVLSAMALLMLNNGIALYGVMKKDSMKLKAASYATFVMALCREGRVVEAYEVFE